MNRQESGKFVAIEGTDGSGKKTQTNLLCEKLHDKNISFEKIDFPRYGSASAYFVEKYLSGGYGESNTVSPKRASIFYALDRMDHQKEIKEWLKAGKLVISDRYTTASMGHQAGKIKDENSKDEFLTWLSDFEYNICENAKPDKIIFLYVPPELSFKMIGERVECKDTKGTKRDIHELDFDHMKKASEAFMYVAHKFDWDIIECAPKGVMLLKEEIHNMIWEKVAPMIK